MASLNSCSFIGNIGKIDSRFTSSGDQVVSLSLACNETWKDKSGEKQERCEWINVVAYKKLAEIISAHCEKGMQIYISGRMQTRKYTDKNGIDRYNTEIIASDMKMLGNRGSGSSDSDESEHHAPSSNNGKSYASGSGFSDMEDDIPF